MLRESNSDFCFSHLPILSGQKLDRKFFVSLNFSWAALHLLRDSQRPPTKHRVHQCASCFNDWSYFPPYPMFWPLFCPFWIGNYQFCKNKRNHMLVWIKAWDPNSQPENQCVVQVCKQRHSRRILDWFRTFFQAAVAFREQFLVRKFREQFDDISIKYPIQKSAI